MAEPARLIGETNVDLSIDKDGNRTYNVTHLVQVPSEDYGPASAWGLIRGIPQVGDSWRFGAEADPWAYCKPNRKVTKITENEKGVLWSVTSTYSTLPSERCQDTTIDNPLDEPDKVSGSFTQGTAEGKRDKDDKPILSSSGEYFSGQANEWDDAQPTVRIGKNYAILPLSTFAPMVNTVNDAPLWGLPKRCIKLNNVSWTPNVYGTCTFYYTVDYEFEVNYNTFDRFFIDEGTKTLPFELQKDGSKKYVDPNKIAPQNNPKNLPNKRRFDIFKKSLDSNGNLQRIKLDGEGREADADNWYVIGPVEYYKESNFLLLDLPTSF